MGEFISWGVFTENEITVPAVPVGYGMQNLLNLFLYVYDKFGSHAVATTQIYSYPPNVIDSDLVDKMLDDATTSLDSGSMSDALMVLASLDTTLDSSGSVSGNVLFVFYHLLK